MAEAKLESSGKHGGKRAGSGRPKGSNNALPQGAVTAIKALKHRVPEGTAEPLADLAGEALVTVANVMRDGARPGAFAQLQAAAAIREEICGPMPKRTEISGPKGEALSITIDLGGKG